MKEALEQLRNRMDSVSAASTSLADALDASSDQLGALEAAGVSLAARMAGSANELGAIHDDAGRVIVNCSTAIDNLLASYTSIMEGFGARISGVSERIGASTELLEVHASDISDLVEQSLSIVAEDFSDVLSEAGGRMSASVEEEFSSAFVGAGEVFNDLLDEAAGRFDHNLAEITGELKHSWRHVADILVDHARNGLVEVIDGAGHRLTREAGDIAQRALVDSLVTAQVAAAMQPMLAPLTPQLMALKPAVPAIQSALEALQMG